MSDVHNPLRDYPVVIQLPVLWGHMDAFQHVNNAVYFRYFESARIAYGEKIEIYRFMRESNIGPILASASCSYLKPLRYPDSISIGARTTKLTSSEMDQEYAIYSQALQKLAAIGAAKVVAYDYTDLRRATFPTALVDRILRLEPHLKLS